MIRKRIAAIFSAFTLMVMAMFATITLPAHAQSASTPTASQIIAAQKKAQPNKERILNYDIAAVLDKDGKMTVTERITVNVENRRIKRGITRSYPVAMRQGQDSLYKFTFDVISTKLDGEPVQHKVEKEKMIVGMAIGNPKAFVSKGVHTYEIVYETNGHVRQFNKFDEIYYNAVGLDVVFPIDKATFSLTLPDGTKPLLTKAYTGKRGQRGSDYKMTGNMSFETTRVLNPNEGFTVVVCWPKGVVVPTHEQAWVSSHRTLALAIIVGAVILVLIFFWFWHFRNATPPAYPIFTPPASLSPGMAAYIDNKEKYVPLMLQADLMWSAIKGFCHVDFSNKNAPAFIWSSKNRQDSVSDKKQPIEEETEEKKKPSPFDNMKKKNEPKRKAKSDSPLSARIAHALFSAVRKIVMGTEKKSGKAHSSLISAWNHLFNFYKPRLKNNSDIKFMPAVWAWLVGQAGLAFIMNDIWCPNNYDTLTMVGLPILSCGFAAFCLLIVWGAWTGIEEILWRYGICAVGIAVAGASIWVNWYIFEGDIILTVTYLLLYALPVAFFCKWHSIPNKDGIKNLQTIEGLKMYINIAEKHRLEVINAPEDSIEQYEAILPYAIALGCAEAWEKRYAPVLSQLNYIPGWIDRSTYIGYSAKEMETWDERQRRLYEENLRRQMFTSITEAPVSVEGAIRQAISDSQQTRISVNSGGGGGGWTSGGSSGGSSGSSSSGSSGGGSGGGGVGGW